MKRFLFLGCFAAAALSSFGCVYARSGYLVYLPSNADPKFRLFVGASRLDWRDDSGLRDYQLQVSLYEGDTPKTLLLFRKTIHAVGDLHYDYSLKGDRLDVLVSTKSGTNLWGFVFERKTKDTFVLSSKRQLK